MWGVAVAGMVLAVAGAGCKASVTAPGTQTDIRPISIDSVEVSILESFPAQVDAHVTGVVGDGCSELLPIEQSRTGNTARLDIRRERPVDAVCIQIALVFDETIRLDGTFLPGDYVLQVNDKSVSFRVD